MEDKTKLTEKDVGLVEDMVFVLKNLIAMEDHSASSFGMTQDKRWLEVLNKIRRIRTKWLGLIVKKESSHLWCFTKHILASMEGLIEIGARFNQTKQYEPAKEAYNDATYLLTLFMLLNDIGKDGMETKSSA